MSKPKIDPDSFYGRLKRGMCPACGEKGPHYVPPGSGSGGFYMCQPPEWKGQAPEQ